MDKLDRFLNPITMSFELLERYKMLLRDTLRMQGLDSNDIETVLQSMQADHRVFLSLNRKFQMGQTSFRQFCADHSLASQLPDRFPKLAAKPLYAHQEKAILSILAGQTTIVSTGTGSGKTEAFLIPILDHCLKHPGSGVKALVVYPMNALANDQVRRLGEATADIPVTFGLFTGSTDERERDAIRRAPPDILITNYVMLDWMLTRGADQTIFEASRNSLKFVVLDELHIYRGNKATHLKYLLARLKARLTGPWVQIGTSATLQSGDVPGHPQSGRKRRDRFIQDLLDIETYQFIKPTYKPEQQEVAEKSAFPTPDQMGDLGWALEVAPQSGLQNLGRLMGKPYSLMDLAVDQISDAPFFRDLQQHAFVQAVRKRLTKDGAQSFVDLVSLLCGMLPASYPRHRAEELVKAFLSAIAFANHHAGHGDQPLLDFRVHLFLQDIGGYLKRCVKCRTYHSGNQEFCQECGFPLFCVYQKDIRHCVAKVSGNRLKWVLRPESDDRKNTYYVLISWAQSDQGSSQDEALGFREEVRLVQDDLILDYDAYGRLRLELLPAKGYGAVLPQLIPLVDGTHQHQYLHNLVKSVLDFQPGHSKKLLGFVDNRERASQYASVLQDEFASAFLNEYLKFCLPVGREIDLSSALEILHRQIPSGDALSAVEQRLFGELDLWFWRTVGLPPRQFTSKQDLLQLRSPESLTSFERDLLDIFLTERAIAKDYSDDVPDSRFIKFEKAYGSDQKGIHCAPENRSLDPRHPSISLGEQAQEYSEFVEQHGHERILEAIGRLEQEDWLVKACTLDGKTHYHLNPRQVCLHVPPSRYSDYWEIRDGHLLTAATHSSEVQDADRRRVEADFQQGDLNFVLATPTLEMGIDIGKLQTVLMVGVPPLPSNYAQRAGRAGRDHQDQFALIVTFCSQSREHDSYYFLRPKLMIDGVIAPPSFNPFNPEVVAKHLHAFVLAGHVGDTQSLARFCADVDAQIQNKVLAVREVFGKNTNAETYLLGDFRTHVLAEASVAISGGRKSPQQSFYATGFFPDYTFRRDQVYLVDSEVLVGKGTTEGLLVDIALSEREPELAYYKFSPGETVFVASDVYQITPEGHYEVIPIDETTSARSYRYLLASRQVRHTSMRKEIRKYAREQIFDNDQPFVDKGKVLGVAYLPNCHLRFVNRGCLQYSDTDPFSDQAGTFSLGYEVRRQAIVLRFNSSVCANERLVLSLASALDRTIKDSYGLDESEIRLLVGVRPDPPGPEASPAQYIVLYDADGNGNVPLETIFGQFDRVLETAHHKMLTCPGSRGQPCEAGCYLCMRSYVTQQFAGSVDKETALMFTGYLLGKNRFRPSIAEPEQKVTEFDLELRLMRSGDEVHVHAPNRSYSETLDSDQNRVIFDLLTQAIQSEFSEGMEALRIRAREDYIVRAINQGAINKNREDFARLQFNLLRFRTVVAEKETA